MSTLVGVNLSSEVFYSCLQTALTTEREEIMGLLLGGKVRTSSNEHIITIHKYVSVQRSDKRGDRVEIPAEQLSKCVTLAERLTKETNIEHRVIGWIHSHPHITVFPSHVDLRTQNDYQMMDPDFIGIIFSVFNNDPSTNIGRIQVTCFQSRQNFSDPNDIYSQSGDHEHIQIPLGIVSSDFSYFNRNSADSILQLPKTILNEHKNAFSLFIERSKLNNSNQLHPMDTIFYSSVYQKKLSCLMEYLCLPLVQSLQDRLDYLDDLLEQKKKELASLQKKK
ncbi:lys-63-specific deubiquitinase brcc36-related [Anaeramoeba ignava]|uniref:Lys-63-specific deubiquitinase brcc36-related n=1 Tax=Anaeramoeba ignava TaxID=1746090 RepID=A0A9Q0R4Y6_ANAIG|nr:lys-63-specific deubiquitinase brcc36-related [Anaeramoeba ignava]